MWFKNPMKLFALLLAGAALTPVAVDDAIAEDVTAAIAAANGPACNATRPFYWEIGDIDGVLASGQVGGTLYKRTSKMNLASASKWVLGAYMLELYEGTPPVAMRDAARMLSGYPTFSQGLCQLSLTVNGCFNMPGNHTHDMALDGKFFYSGGNSQYLAANVSLLDLGTYTTKQLTQEVQAVVGTSMSYQFPALSAGLQGSAEEYAQFLTRLMTAPEDGGLIMYEHLGTDTVATLPCPAGHEGCSPGGSIPWSYGDHYWVEDNITSGRFNKNGSLVGPGDGAFSSPGAWGFYPWISANKDIYGIVARRALLGTAFRDSVICGQAIRYAFTGYVP